MAGPVATHVTDVARLLLGTYLTTEFNTAGDGVTVLPEWPNPGAELPEKAVCITIAEGVEPEVRYWPPAEFRLIPDAGVSPISGVTQYTYGRFKLPLQLDVWTRYPAVRSYLAGRLGKLLFRHPNETLALDSFVRLSRWHELVLRDVSLPGFLVYYRFNELPVPQDSGRASQEGEYRLTVTGIAEGLFTSQEAVALIRDLTIELDAGPDTLGAGTAETVTVTAP